MNDHPIVTILQMDDRKQVIQLNTILKIFDIFSSESIILYLMTYIFITVKVKYKYGS